MSTHLLRRLLNYGDCLRRNYQVDINKTNRKSGFVFGLLFGILFCFFTFGTDNAFAKPSWKNGTGSPDRSSASKKQSTVEETIPVNEAPVISGAPDAEVSVDAFYDFMPLANDPEGDAVEFSISQKPAWADFDVVSGALYGAPIEADVGIYDAIRISVNDGQHTVFLPPFSIEVTPFVYQFVELNWQPPLDNENGSQLIDLAGFRIYFRDENEALILLSELMNPGLTSYRVDALGPEIWSFSVTALNSEGIESEPSNIAEYDLR
jgi:hypothetical protein